MSSARLARHSVAERWSQQIGRTGNDGWRPEREERQVGHESQKRQAADPDWTSHRPTGEARQAGREDIESLSVVHEPERPTNTLCLERVSATSRTVVYGPVRTVVWEGRSREAPPYPDLWHL
jgi:hypothetical protein